MPLSGFFERSERVVLALLYRCQRRGLFKKSKLKLATATGDLWLPRVWSHLSTRSLLARKGFPVKAYSGADAEYIMRMIMDDTDTMPVHYDQFFELARGVKIYSSGNAADVEMEDA
jgi:hypothetical protein